VDEKWLALPFSCTHRKLDLNSAVLLQDFLVGTPPTNHDQIYVTRLGNVVWLQCDKFGDVYTAAQVVDPERIEDICHPGRVGLTDAAKFIAQLKWHDGEEI
jgi:hypothetical protein